jgi:hypothetical protein
MSYDRTKFVYLLLADAYPDQGANADRCKRKYEVQMSIEINMQYRKLSSRLGVLERHLDVGLVPVARSPTLPNK